VKGIHAFKASTPVPYAALAAHCERWGYWSPESTQRSLQDPRYELLFHQQSPEAPWSASLLYWIGEGYAELLYLFTEPSVRKQGIGKSLFLAMETRLRALPHCHRVCLEVRVSNHSAQSLYCSMGMHEERIRTKYYEDGEDARLMAKEW